MDAADSERVYRAFGDFHSHFNPLFGRRADDAIGVSPSLRETWQPWVSTTSWTFRRGSPCGLRSRNMEPRSDKLPEEAWREITVAQGSQGPLTYRFTAQRVRPTSRRKPGDEACAVYRRNLDGSEPRYYLSNAPEDTPLVTLAYLGGSRGRIETEFETEKGEVRLDEYETRTWAGWYHHVALCLLASS